MLLRLHSRRGYLRLALALTLLYLLGLQMIEVGPARAATCTVADGDIVNLKTTLTSANAGTGCTEGISLATGGTYTLTVADNTVTNGNGLGGNGLPQISGPGKVLIYGNGATIQRSNAATDNFRLFYISSTGDLTLDNLTIKGGKIDNGANVNAYGGGLSNAGKLTLTRSTVTSNSSVSSAASTTNIQAGAGGIFNENLATTTLNNSIISNNSAIITVNTAGGIQSGGGGLLNNDTGILNLLNSTVSGNSISVITPTTNAILALGGGISNNGTLNLLNNTVNNNSITVAAGGSVSTVGGGIFSVVTANLANSTVANNSTSSTSTSTTTQIISIGGGIYLNGANAGLASLTIVNNTAGFSGGNNTSIAVGGGIYGIGGTVKLQNDLIANNTLTGINTFAPDIYEATLTSNGYNLIGNSTGSTGFGANDILNPAGGAKVGTLSSNGGPTQTAPLNAGSPAIDAGTPAGCTSLSSGTNPLFTNGAAIPTDQRYFGRSGTGNRCDIGAFEYQAVTLAAPTLSQTFNPTTVLVAQTSTLTFTLTNPAANPSKLDNIQFNAVLSGPGAFSGVLSGTCGLTAPASGTSLNTTGVSLNAAASCTIIVTVTSTGAGTVSSTVSSIFAAQTGNTALVGNVANLTVTAPATATTTVLSSSAAGNTSVVGQSVTFTATVSPTAGGGTPTGTVTFTITQGATTVTSQGKALSGGAASLSYAFATTGAYTVKASYGGDTNFAVSNATDLSHSVTSATTSTVLTSNAPSNTIPVGQNVTFTATVSAVGPGAGIPTGIVTFRLDGVDQTPTVVLDSAGKASFSTSSLAVGSHTLTASFGGGTNYQASNSSNLVLTVTAATVSLVVSVPGDDGSGSVIGTLSYALKQASSGSIISFNLPIGVSIIAVSGKLPSVPKGVSVQGICSAGKPQITIDGTGVSSTSDGLVLLGQVQLNGLKVKGFKGKQIVAQSQGNKLSCVVAQRS